jgi:D-lactate dehydrogenase (cytochrome)
MKSYIGKQVIREQLPEILYDESRFTLGIPDAVYFPQTVSDVRDVVLDAQRSKIPITVIGGKTGIAGGSVPIDGCVALCMSDMNRIVRVSRGDGGNYELCSEPGVTIENIAAFLADPGAWPSPVDGTAIITPGGLFYPPDPTETTAQLGGTIATNASGARSFRFGPTRAHVLELRIVLANGETLLLRRGAFREKNGLLTAETEQGNCISVRKPLYRSPAVKNASGYFSAPDMDLIDLFIGSEGTLGVFAQCTVRLMVQPRFSAGLTFFPDRKAAFGAAAFLRAEPMVSAIEYFDQTALAFLEAARKELPFDLPLLPNDRRNAVYWEYIESEGVPFDDQMDKWETAFAGFGSSFEHTWSGFEPKEIERLKAIRHAVPEAVNSAVARYKRDCPGIRKISTDTALPAPAFERVFKACMEKIAASQLLHAVFGHLGDFHLHANLVPQSEAELDKAKRLYDDLMRITVANGGTVSAEHGIGKLKVKYLQMMYGDAAIEEMRAIKSSLDPLWLINRGTLLEYK